MAKSLSLGMEAKGSTQEAAIKGASPGLVEARFRKRHSLRRALKSRSTERQASPPRPRGVEGSPDRCPSRSGTGETRRKGSLRRRCGGRDGGCRKRQRHRERVGKSGGRRANLGFCDKAMKPSPGSTPSSADESPFRRSCRDAGVSECDLNPAHPGSSIVAQSRAGGLQSRGPSAATDGSTKSGNSKTD